MSTVPSSGNFCWRRFTLNLLTTADSVRPLLDQENFDAHPRQGAAGTKKKQVEKNAGSTKTLKVAKNLWFWCCWSILFCSSEEPTESNVWVQFWVIPSFKLLYKKGFYSANFPEVATKLAQWWVKIAAEWIIFQQIKTMASPLVRKRRLLGYLLEHWTRRLNIHILLVEAALLYLYILLKGTLV